MSDTSKAVVRRFVDGYQSGHDVTVADEILAADFVDHCPFGSFSPDRDGVLALFDMFFSAFPDLRADIHDQVAEGDKVTTRKTFRGTHQGPFMGIPPTGNAVEWDVIDIVRVEDGTICEHWNVVDALSLLQQVGAVPPMG
jgi:steroid delta-isomerase-like uncharacterized protein